MILERPTDNPRPEANLREYALNFCKENELPTLPEPPGLATSGDTNAPTGAPCLATRIGRLPFLLAPTTFCRLAGFSIPVPSVETRMKASNWANRLASISLGLLRCVALAWLFAGELGSALADTPPVFEPPPAPGAVSYDGIYLWSPGNFLSLHQDGTHMIATIYFTNDGNFTFPAAAGGGTLPVPQLDVFDLMGGQVTGSTATVYGTRFHRACNVGYNLTFNPNATITVTRTGYSNTAAADSAGISCSAILGAEATTLTAPKIRFNQ